MCCFTPLEEEEGAVLIFNGNVSICFANAASLDFCRLQDLIQKLVFPVESNNCKKKNCLYLLSKQQSHIIHRCNL